MSDQSEDDGVDRDPGGHRIALRTSQDEGTLAALLRHRRSTKSYKPNHLTVQALRRLLGTVAGSMPAGQRPYGSAHGRYDVAVTVIASAVESLDPAAYQYLPAEHALLLREPGDHRSGLAGGTLDAQWLTECPVVLLLSADLTAANEAFKAQGEGRGERFCCFETGLIAQNIYLWAAENALGTVFIAGLDSLTTQAATRHLVPPSHTVLGMLPIGHPANAQS